MSGDSTAGVGHLSGLCDLCVLCGSILCRAKSPTHRAEDGSQARGIAAPTCSATGSARDQWARPPHPGAVQAEDVFKDAPLAWPVSGSDTPKVETLASSAMDCHLGAVAYSASPRVGSDQCPSVRISGSTSPNATGQVGALAYRAKRLPG